ncbi:carbohydrate ABC transporter permease [Catellatospora citrea]|uniref:ABC transporter permease n=1 Tax=Catellatospora citrea TaxID=53366 RepID=A0A8J3KD15_9ACTN|nr:sugar ABC transporter permease [Catellatospora citrea]RKE11350.1 carbohydrate ABC transporter membrane protein 1 (CUT1 family) [Catellatospora citrea]GIF96818.1 ABC transporter permease [Catellatospora citrea]
MADLLTATPATTSAAPSPRARDRRRARRNTLIGWSFILPNFLGFVVLTLVPVLAAFALSFMEWDSYNPPEWVGLDNFTRLLNDESTKIALRNTAFYALGHVPLTMLAALGLALLLNRKIAGVGFFRAAAFFPYITSMVAVAIVWNMLFNPEFGPVNQFLQFVGVDSPPGWTTSTTWAMPAVILTSVWRDMGYYMVLFLAGLQAIPVEQYEAAKVDGASTWQRFRAVTLPGLRPVTFLVLVLLTVQSFKVFDLIVVMTDGGPGRATLVLSQQIYRRGIIEGEFGYASAISLVLFLLVLVFTLVQFWFNNRQERR